MKIFITIPWFLPAYKAGGPVQSVANMVEVMGNEAIGNARPAERRSDGGNNAIGNRQYAISNNATGNEATGNNTIGNEAIGNRQSNSAKASMDKWAISNNTIGNEAIEFKIFCGNRDLDGSLLQGVAFDEWVDHASEVKVWYSSSNNILPLLQREIKMEKPDYLFITGIYDWQYNFKPLLFCRGVKKIISVRGMLHPGALSQKPLKKKIYLALWKMLGMHGQSTFAKATVDKSGAGSAQGRVVFHATDEEEKKFIQDMFGRSVRVQVAGNFPNLVEAQPVMDKKPGHLKLVSIALISPMKNILMVLEGLRGYGEEILRSAQDDSLRGGDVVIEYNIYGPVKDKHYWQLCGELIKKMPQNIVVKYHGELVPGKIAEALAGSHVFILPSKSENFGHAIYEALGAGRPVITSDTTPWNNLQEAKAGINVSLANTGGLTDAVGFFAAMGNEEMKAWSAGAKAYADAAVDVEKIKKQYADLFS